MSKLIENRWAATKEALCEGSDLTKNFDGSFNATKRDTMAVLLENTRVAALSQGALFEAATAGSTSSSNIAVLNKVMLPLIRRVMPTIIANEIIGVQPMTGPVGQISTLRTVYSNNVGGVNGVHLGQEALSPYNIAAFYSGNELPAAPAAAFTNDLESRPGNELSIEILKATVEAKTRRLSARWTFEAGQDAQSQYGIDLEQEVLNSIAQHITVEIDQEILNSLRALPGAPGDVYDQATVSGTPTYVGEEHAALAILINKQSNEISARTMRGPANWAVVSQRALTILQSAGTSAFARTTEGTFEAPTNVKFVGTLNGSIRVYVDKYAKTDDVLIGYKGPTETDAAAFYCPYVPLVSSGIVIDPNTFNPVVSFMTRYGYLELSNTVNSFGNAADYLGLIGVNTATLRFQ